MKQPSGKPQIPVLGGTGKTGRKVVEKLINRGIPVRIGSRSGDLQTTCWSRFRPGK